MLADAIKRAGGTDSAKLKDAINATKNFAGVTGMITLDAGRNAVKPAVVLALDPAAGAFKFKETIYPEGMTPPAGASDSNSNANSNSNAAAGSAANTAAPAEKPAGGLPTPAGAVSNSNANK